MYFDVSRPVLGSNIWVIQRFSASIRRVQLNMCVPTSPRINSGSMEAYSVAQKARNLSIILFYLI